MPTGERSQVWHPSVVALLRAGGPAGIPGSRCRRSLLCAESCKLSSPTTARAEGFCLRLFAAGSAVQSPPESLR
jgi:hypothetical protein